MLEPMVNFRKSKKIGGVRFTVSKSGFSASTGVPGLRASVNSKGDVRRTVGLPGTGIYDTKVVGKLSRSATPAGAGGTNVSMSVVEASRGRRDLLSGSPELTYLEVVGVSGTHAQMADLAGIQANADGWRRGIRPAVLTPGTGNGYDVIVLVEYQDNPSLFGRKDRETPKAKPFGRLTKKDADKWVGAFAGRDVMAVAYIDATPGRESAEVRFFSAELEEDPAAHEAGVALAAATEAAEESAVAASSPKAPSGWYPVDSGQLRYWDGLAWTDHFHQP